MRGGQRERKTEGKREGETKIGWEERTKTIQILRMDCRKESDEDRGILDKVEGQREK